MKERKSNMKKYIAICSTLALVSASQAAVIFQEDFSGYAVATNPLNAPQVGTWTQNGGYAAVATYHTLLDGTAGPCMEFVDGTAHLVPSLEANFISYAASPIKVTYDFLMRRTAINDQAFSVFANAAGEKVTYSLMQDANGTQDWIYMFGKDPSGITSYLGARDTWYTMEMELPIMPASGTFSMKWTIYDATGVAIHTESNQTSWSGNAGSDLIDELVFQAGGGIADKTSVLIDNILVETIPEPATLGMFGLAGVLAMMARRLRI